MLGADTPPPILNAPPPMPPPDPGPNPGPDPDPTPPPRPLPIPPPDPKPFEAKPDFASGSPNASTFTFGIFVSGMINVGSITSFELSGGRTIGGTNCRLASFGKLPLLTGAADRSPPPPPPCIASFFTAGR